MNKSTLLSVVFILFVTSLIFFKLFLKGLYPIPGDLLVSFYFPYYSGGWEGYNSWTTHKEMFGADSIRQIYLWKELAADQFKKGQFPLWNPYTFSGQPLLANFQSSVFYPLNIFYFLTDPRNAWIILIIAQPFLGGFFMFLAARSFKLSKIASLFTSISFMLSSYLITWMENGNVSHSYIWLPLIFWSINNYFNNYKFRYFLTLSASLSMSILAGHPQTAIYLYIITAIYWIYKSGRNLTRFVILLAAVSLSTLLSAIQLIPTADFYTKSPISLPFAREVFDRAILPYKNLITFFAPDFFGHPASNNFWSQTYGDFTPYIGVLPLIFCLWAIFKLWKLKFIKFATITSVFFIISSAHGPITYLIKTLQIPLLNSTSPSRFMSISMFLMIIIAGFGIEDFLQKSEKANYLRSFIKFLFVIGMLYVFMWIFTVVGPSFLTPSDTWYTNLTVTRRNLIIPSLMFTSLLLMSAGIYLFRAKNSGIHAGDNANHERGSKYHGIQAVCSLLFPKIKIKKETKKNLIVAGIFTLTLFGGIYFSNKFLPFAPNKFIFPDHPLFTYLKDNIGINRFYGGGTARVDYNMPTHYQLYVSEGYDTLRLKRYAELLASARNSGKIPVTYLRSDAAFPDEENGYRKRLFDLLGVKFLLDKEDTPKTGQDWDSGKFPNDNVEGFWQDEKFLVYVRQNVLPRVFLTTNYITLKSDQEIIDKVFDKNFDLRTIILEEEPSIQIQKLEENIVEPKIIKYEPNQATFSTNPKNNSLLFLSDAYDADWHSYIDGKKSNILRADYALRAVAVPAGEHTVDFKYQPKAFVIGAIASLSGILFLIMLIIYFARKKQF